MSTPNRFCKAISVRFNKVPLGSKSNVFNINSDINQVKFDIPVKYIPSSWWHFENPENKNVTYIGVFTSVDLTDKNDEFQLMAPGKLYEIDRTIPKDFEECLSTNKECKMIIAGNNNGGGGVFGLLTYN